MKAPNSIVCILLVGLIASVSDASVTINYDFGELRGVDGQPVPDGSAALLVVDTAGSGFLGDYTTGDADFGVFNSVTLSQGEQFGPSNEFVIILSGSITSGDIFGGVSFDLESGVASGDEIGLYWLPSTSSGTTVSGDIASYGFYRSDTVNTASGSTIAFSVPSDGATESLGSLDQSLESGSFTTEEDFTAIPEPSAYATILGLLGLGYAVFCRRRRSSSTD